MSKGLERRLELLKNRALSDLDSIPTTAISICEKSNEEVMEAYETIKQALQRLEEIDKANPSEALKALDRNIVVIREKDYTIIEQALLNVQELEKENQELIKKADCCLWKDCNKISQENQELKNNVKDVL